MRTTVDPDLASHLRLVVTRTARRLRQEAGFGLSPALTAALSTVERFGPLTPSEVAERERVKRPTATRILGRLEEEGLIVRAADPGDGRSSLVSVTPAGSALLATMRQRKDAFLARRLEGLSEEDRATVARAADLLEGLLEDDA